MKKFLKLLKRAAENFWVRLVLLLGCIVGIFALGGAFESKETAGAKILELITSIDILSIFLAAAVSLIVADVVIKLRHRLEESYKIDDDHHKIICKYFEHGKDDIVRTENLCDKRGEFMYLRSVPPRKKRKRAKNPVRDRDSAAYKNRDKLMSAYMNDGKLYMPSVSIFTNVLGDTELKFDDTAKFFELPPFITGNFSKLMEAHKASEVNNGVTVRLKDIDYAGGTLTLFTERSHYFDMLVTNRCMDYRDDDGISVREALEYGDTVTPLRHSELGNQIGINGIIVTRDGYLLVEKRGNKKTTWKDKFAQPISLAMKLKDTGLDLDGKFDDKPSTAAAVFKNIVTGTVKNNFGITENDIVEFDIKTNFLGIARDLLEGGKPNMYFYVAIDKTADELAELLTNKFKKACACVGGAPRPNEALPKVNRAKLDSDYYLIKYDDMVIDYDYVLKADARRIKHVKRKFYPCVGRAKERADGRTYRRKRRTGGKLVKECGEALLACLYYADACGERITKQLKELNKKHEENKEYERQ